MKISEENAGNVPDGAEWFFQCNPHENGIEYFMFDDFCGMIWNGKKWIENKDYDFEFMKINALHIRELQLTKG